MEEHILPRGTEPATDPLVEQADEVQRKIERNAGKLGNGFALVFLGFPGAGKSIASQEASDKLEEKTGSEPLVVDIKKCAERFQADEYDATEFIDRISLEFDLPNSSLAVIDGAKSFDELTYLAYFFDELGIIYLDSHSQARHHRLIEAARSDGKVLSEFSHEKLRELDVEAAAAGLDDIEQVEFCDMKIENNDIDRDKFLQAVSYASSDLYVDYKHR